MDKARWFGAWRLEAMELRNSRGTASYPYGRNPTGYIMYLQPDRVAVAFGNGDRPAFSTEDMLGGTLEENCSAFDTFVSYCGTFEVEADRVVHHIEVSLFPNWVGANLTRLYGFEGDTLRLSTTPFLIQGEQQTAHLIWRRV